MSDLPQYGRPALGYVRFVAAVFLLYERLWRRALPLVILICLFFICVWGGIFFLLPPWLHIGLLGLFTVGALAALLPLCKLRLPHRGEIDRTIERNNDLAFQPLAIQSDQIVRPDTREKIARLTPEMVLWQEHQRRMKTCLKNLRSGLPFPNIPALDPYGLRSVFFLGFAIAFAYSFSPNSGQIADLLSFKMPPLTAMMRIDAWVVPPNYTDHAPIYLKSSKESEGPHKMLTVPQHSLVHVHLTGADHQTRLVLFDADAQGANSEIVPVERDKQKDVTAYQIPLLKDSRLVLTTTHDEQIWHFTILEDKPPQIEWLEEPRRALNGTLELRYKIEDDYGAHHAWAVITAPDWESPFEQDLALYDAPTIPLALPRQGQGEARTSQDLSEHPWAGIPVQIRLFVEDGAGHRANSPDKILTLPQRSFGHPLARALVEQRRLLAFDRTNKNRVSDMLSALLLRPQDTIKNAAHTLALQTIWTRLHYAQNDAALRDVIDYMWIVALGIEGDGLIYAEQRLKQAAQALRHALRDGASTDEIERLMQNLRQAMQDYMTELATREPLRPPPPEAQGQMLEQNEFDRRLQEIEDMAQLGNRAAAEQLLAELEQIMDNLQLFQGETNKAEGNRPGRAQQNMNALADQMRRQQEMLNETDRLNQEQNNGDASQETYRRAMETLQQRQGELHRHWEELIQQFAEQEMNTEALGEAGQAMAEAQAALQGLDGGGDAPRGKKHDGADARSYGSIGGAGRRR